MFVDEYKIGRFRFCLLSTGSDLESGVVVQGGHILEFETPEYQEALKKALAVYRGWAALKFLEEYCREFSRLNVNRAEIIAHAGEIALTQDVFKLSAIAAEAIQKANEILEAKKKKDENASGYVYLIQSPTGHYKIGRTKNPFNRMRTFEVKLPFEIEYVCLLSTTNMYELETRLHRQFADKRVNGEWFTLSSEDVEIIKAVQS